MKNKAEIIQFYEKNVIRWIIIISLITNILFIAIASILIQTSTERIINLALVLIVNLVFLLILWGFSKNKYACETIYQIEVDPEEYQTKIWRFFLVIFGITWISFFSIIAIYMIINHFVYQIEFDYFYTLSQSWWKSLLITTYNVSLFLFYRQLLSYLFVHRVELPVW